MKAQNYGVILGEPAQQYHETFGVSSHRIADFRYPNCPLLYYRKHVLGSVKEDPATEALAFGEYFHCLALEGENAADARFVVAPKFDRRTNAGKAEAAIFEAQNEGKKQISKDDFELAWQMVKSIRAKTEAVKLFAKGKPEVVFRHKMAAFDIQCRADWYDEELDEWKRPLIVDLKSIDCLANFERQFFKFNYWYNLGFYQLVVFEAAKLTGAFPRFRFVVVEKQEPFRCGVFEPDELTMDRGRAEVMTDLTKLKGCYDNDNWPGEPDEVRPIGLPEWFLLRTSPDKT